MKKRFQDRIETLNQTYQKDMKSKVNRMTSERLNVERSNKVAMENQKDYYENKMKGLAILIHFTYEALLMRRSVIKARNSL